MVSDADEAHLQELASLINERIRALGAKAARTASPTQQLAVIALGLADDLLTLQRERDSRETALRTVIAQAIERIDRQIEALDTTVARGGANGAMGESSGGLGEDAYHDSAH